METEMGGGVTYKELISRNGKVKRRIFELEGGTKRKGSYIFNIQMKMINEIHSTLEKDEDYRNYMGPEKRDIIYKYFVPIGKRDIPGWYYPVIAVITEYFECRAFWINHFSANLADPIKTVKLIGYKHNVVLCSTYLANTLNSIQTLHFHKGEYYRRMQHNRRKRARYNGYKKSTSVKDSRVRTRQSVEYFINRLYKFWLRKLYDKKFNIKYFTKMDDIYKRLRQDGEIYFPKRKGSPSIQTAECQKNIYQERKLIMLNKVLK